MLSESCSHTLPSSSEERGNEEMRLVFLVSFFFYLGCTHCVTALAFQFQKTIRRANMGYGDIMKVETTGASWQTAQQDGPSSAGVAASHTMAQTDAGRMEKYRSKINNVGQKYGIAPALIAAIISRESRAGNVLHDGWGDYNPSKGAYNAWGLMQVDVNPNGGGHTARGGWDSEEHLCQGTEILVYFIGRIRNKFPSWSTEQQLKGGIAAYNMGDGNVHSYDNVDGCTTGGDYSNDVVARAQWYKTKKGY